MHGNDGFMKNRILVALGELVDALDRRVPRAGRAGEIQIVKDAAALRSAAVTRMSALRRTRPDRPAYDQALADAIMADDGNPTQPFKP